MFKQLLAAVAALTLAPPIAAQAQEIPSYAVVQSDQQIQGRVTNFDGAYNLQVRDDNGYLDNVELHDGTVINPTGLTLAPGMIVNVLGDNGGSVFDANEIDTPYAFDNAVPSYSGHPWNYYGSSVNLSFFFGNTNWWHHPSGNGGSYHSGGAYDQSSRRDNHPSRNAPAVPQPQPVRYNPGTEPAAPTQFAPPARVAAPVRVASPVRPTAPIERVTPQRVTIPQPIERIAPVVRTNVPVVRTATPVQRPSAPIAVNRPVTIARSPGNAEQPKRR